MLLKTYVFLLLLTLIVLSFPQKVISATQSITTSSTPSSIDQSQEFSINIVLSCSGCSDSYLRGVFYPSGTSYFGYTQDNIGNWSNSPGSGCLSYYKVSQTDFVGGSWSGTLKFKPDKDSAFYNGPGEYLFKIGRYTASCSSPSVWSNETTIALTGPTSDSHLLSEFYVHSRVNKYANTYTYESFNTHSYRQNHKHTYS